ncbi:hypothetical protein RB195_010453 [Necator americanus]|uniref:Integrase zinc-binding domain-containing protein n=1 Tax=Necator americanus TaxID=51031 RepID=A0ABR1CY02_NECAM
MAWTWKTLSRLVITDCHRERHVRIRYTMYRVRERYWIPKLRAEEVDTFGSGTRSFSSSIPKDVTPIFCKERCTTDHYERQCYHVCVRRCRSTRMLRNSRERPECGWGNKLPNVKFGGSKIFLIQHGKEVYMSA